MSKYLLAIFSRHIHNHSAAFATALRQALCMLSVWVFLAQGRLYTSDPSSLYLIQFTFICKAFFTKQIVINKPSPLSTNTLPQSSCSSVSVHQLFCECTRLISIHQHSFKKQTLFLHLDMFIHLMLRSRGFQCKQS